MNKVLIVRGSYSYEQMFRDAGWLIVHNVHAADLVCFTGGSDVDPALYGEARHSSSMVNTLRDVADKVRYDEALSLGIPMVGICRGGQFLNVMCGGSMWQDVDKHAIGHLHSVLDVSTGESYDCTSTHHQMMLPTDEATIIGTADESTKRLRMDGNTSLVIQRVKGEDIEVVGYPAQNVLCFQPHPEMTEVGASCREYFFKLLERELEVV